jgi:hypothetical protein
MPVEADALRLFRLVLVLAIPVAVEIDKLFKLALVLASPVAVETDRLYNWLPVTASVDPEAILPSLNCVTLRVKPIEALPTLTTLVAPPSELLIPNATDWYPTEVALWPNATPPLLANAYSPTATDRQPPTDAFPPKATDPLIPPEFMLAFCPINTLSVPLVFRPAFAPMFVLPPIPVCAAPAS